jgi:hypothetical protein
VLKDDQPVAPDLTVAIGDADRYIDRLTLLICAPDALDTVTEAEVALSGDVEIRDVEFRGTREYR